MKACSGLILDEKFKLMNVIGRGSTGMVWRAIDLPNERPCAVKIVHSIYYDHSSSKNFDAWSRVAERESVALSCLRTPHVPAGYGSGTDRGFIYYAMELIDGLDLGHEIKISKPGLEPIRALTILCGVSRALEAVHKAGMVHRDVKPSNVIIALDGRGVLIDFGLVLLPSGAGASGQPIGTPRYMAPEMATGAPTAEEQPLADLYSLAATTYEALTGKPPFAGDGASEVIEKHVHERPQEPTRRCPELPACLDELIMRGLEKNPKERYPSCEAFRLAMEEVQNRLRVQGG